MFGALLYLRLTSLKNRLLSRVKRLRQPKYLAGGIVGALWFWFTFLRPLGSARGAGGGARRQAMAQVAQVLPIDWLPLAAAFGAVILLLIVVLAWAVPGDTGGLLFSEAEIAFLFPAPMTRRALIHYKLISSQFAIFFTSLFFALVSNRWSFLGGNAATHAVGWWAILSTLNLHFAGAALARLRLARRGVDATRRRWFVLGGGGVILVATAAWVWGGLPAPTTGETTDFAQFTQYLVSVASHGPLGWLLWPFRLVLGPFLAADLPGFFLALGPVLLLMAAHYYLVLRMETDFEEASIALAQKRATVVAAVRSGNYRFGRGAKARRGPFRLADTGRPELAFLWKNLLSTAPYLNRRTFLWCGTAILVGCTWLRAHAEWRALSLTAGIIGLIAAGYILFLGPQLARQDIRSDLANADILKIYPLPGWQVILGELLTPAVILTSLLWLALLAAGLSFQPLGVTWLTPALRVTLAACLGALAPVLMTLQLLVPNAATLVFPAWAQSTRTRGGGIDVMGQRLIFVFGQFLVIVVVLLPAAAAAALLVFATQWLVGPVVAVMFATVAVLAVLIGEIWCALWWLGGRFEKLDLSAELRP